MSYSFDTRNPVARKRRRCEACNTVIEPGTSYFSKSTAYDGTVSTWFMCADCQPLLNTILEYTGNTGNGVTFDDFYAWATDHPDNEIPGHGAQKWLSRFRKAEEEL